MYICQSQSPNSSHPPPPLSPLGVHTFVLSICGEKCFDRGRQAIHNKTLNSDLEAQTRKASWRRRCLIWDWKVEHDLVGTHSRRRLEVELELELEKEAGSDHEAKRAWTLSWGLWEAKKGWTLPQGRAHERLILSACRKAPSGVYGENCRAFRGDDSANCWCAGNNPNWAWKWGEKNQITKESEDSCASRRMCSSLEPSGLGKCKLE